MKKKYHRFEIYRYQLLPLDRFFQGELFGDVKSVDDLIAKKNEIFSEYLRELRIISGKSLLHNNSGTQPLDSDLA